MRTRYSYIGASYSYTGNGQTPKELSEAMDGMTEG
jgi:hypothetical protein